MSTDNKDNVMVAILAMRLQTAHNGFYRGLEMTQPLLGNIIKGITEVISDQTVDIVTVRKLTRLLLPSLRMLYEQFLPTEIEYAKKFLAHLRSLNFDTTSEMQRIREFELLLDDLIPPVERLDMVLADNNSTLTRELYDDVMINMLRASEAHHKFDEIRKDIDKRVQDVLKALSMLIDPVRAEVLYEAFTKEP